MNTMTTMKTIWVTPSLHALLTVALCLPAFTASAATYPVDDSASVVLGSQVKMAWGKPSSSQTPQSAVFGSIAVQVVLNTKPWKGQAGKIYMTLQPQPIGLVTVAWRSRGQLLPGTLKSGERGLVYSGGVDRDTLTDTLVLTITADGQNLVSPEHLHFSFEIDTDTP